MAALSTGYFWIFFLKNNIWRVLRSSKVKLGSKFPYYAQKLRANALTWQDLNHWQPTKAYNFKNTGNFKNIYSYSATKNCQVPGKSKYYIDKEMGHLRCKRINVTALSIPECLPCYDCWLQHGTIVTQNKNIDWSINK